MGVVRGELHPFRLALKSPLVIGGVSARYRAGFLVSLTSEGHTGWGEASPLPGWSRTTLLQTEPALHRAVDEFGAGGADAVGPLLASMEGTPHARAAVAGAWFDLQARRAGRNLAEHLAPDASRAPAPAVAVNALVAAAEPLQVERAVRDAVEEGFKAVKLKVGAADPALDVERVRAARSALGPAPELRLDANGAWDESTALDVLGAVRDCHIAFCEEPVAGIDAIAALSLRSPVPVAVDESVRSTADAEHALALGIRTVVVKPQALGGPDVALSVAARAREAGAATVVTSFLDSAVGLVHALHVAAAVDATVRLVHALHMDAAVSPGPAHGLATSSLLTEDVAEPPPVVAGVMCLTPSPGIGVVPV